MSDNLPSMPDWRNSEEPNTSRALQTTTAPALETGTPTKIGAVQSHLQQCERAWSEFLLTPGYSWVKKGGGLVAFVIFTVSGLSLYGVASWLFPFLPVYGWVLTLFATTLLAQAFVIHYANLGNERRGVLTAQVYEADKKQITESLNASEQRYTELTKHKIVFEIRQAGCRIFLRDLGGENPVEVTVKLELRFENKDTATWAVKGLRISLCEQGEEDIYLTAVKHYNLGKTAIAKRDFERTAVLAGDVTETYSIHATLSISDKRIQTVNDLNAAHFIKVALRTNATQSPVEAAIHLDWTAAIKDRGTIPTRIDGVPVVEIWEDVLG